MHLDHLADVLASAVLATAVFVVLALGASPAAAADPPRGPSVWAARAAYPPGPTVAGASVSFPPGPGVAAASGSYPPGPTVAGIIWDA